MIIQTLSENRLRLHSALDPAFGFDIGDDAGLSPFHLLAASLATCTFSVLHGWAHQAQLPLDDLEITIDWDFGDDPLRVTDMRMEVRWPGLPEARAPAARRVAAHCTIHHTLERGAHVETTVDSPA